MLDELIMYFRYGDCRRRILYTTLLLLGENNLNQKLNNFHENLIFTMESNTLNQLPFFEMNLKIEENKFTTLLYKKKTIKYICFAKTLFFTPQSWKKYFFFLLETTG